MISPVSDKILIAPLAEEDKVGMIFLPGKRDKKIPIAGVVVALGNRNLTPDGTKEIPFEVSPGDHVIFHRGTGEEVFHEDQPYILTREEFILAIIDKNAQVE